MEADKILLKGDIWIFRIWTYRHSREKLKKDASIFFCFQPPPATAYQPVQKVSLPPQKKCQNPWYNASFLALLLQPLFQKLRKRNGRLKPSLRSLAMVLLCQKLILQLLPKRRRNILRLRRLHWLLKLLLNQTHKCHFFLRKKSSWNQVPLSTSFINVSRPPLRKLYLPWYSIILFDSSFFSFQSRISIYAATDPEKLNDDQKRTLKTLPTLEAVQKELGEVKKAVEVCNLILFIPTLLSPFFRFTNPSWFTSWLLNVLKRRKQTKPELLVLYLQRRYFFFFFSSPFNIFKNDF